MRSYRLYKKGKFKFYLVGRGVEQGVEMYFKDTNNVE